MCRETTAGYTYISIHTDSMHKVNITALQLSLSWTCPLITLLIGYYFKSVGNCIFFFLPVIACYIQCAIYIIN